MDCKISIIHFHIIICSGWSKMIRKMEDNKKYSKLITITYLNGKMFNMPHVDPKNV